MELTQWGDELYCPVGKDLGEENLIEDIPPGGIAYTRKGNLVCIFFGQTPAWAVEHIGGIVENQWQLLLGTPPVRRVKISAKP